MSSVIIVGLCNSRKKQRGTDGLPIRNTTVWWINEWIREWNIGSGIVSFCNLSGDPDWDGKHPETEYLRIIMGYDNVIALGAGVSRHLERAGIQHIKFEHPSGLNRNMNDKEYTWRRHAEIGRRLEQSKT